MKPSTILLTVFSAVFVLGGVAAFAQHGGGHGAGPGVGPGAGPGMDQGRGRSASSTSRMGDNAESSRAMSKTPEQLLTQNKNLSSRLQALLPPGTNLQDATKGFKNLGQFVASVHVSHNLSIPFDDLKSKMLSGESLGNAIHDLKPDVNAKGEAKKAHKQGKETMQETKS
jgi:hypothetical protein